MVRTHTVRRGGGRVFAQARAAFVVTVMAIAGGLLAEAGRQVQAQDAEATYVRTAGPATPPGVSGG